MSLLLVAALASFACASPTHHDGDAIRCAGSHRSDRLYGIDAPEMPGACHPGRNCTDGDPFAARDHLAALTRGRPVHCDQVDSDVYGRRIVRCSAGNLDLSCAMVADGYAVPRYGPLDCGARADMASAAQPDRTSGGSVFRTASLAGSTLPLIVLASWLLLINAATYIAFGIDKQRAIAGSNRRTRRIPESTLLSMSAAGGIVGALLARRNFRHKTRKQPFSAILLAILAIQLLVIAALLTSLV